MKDKLIMIILIVLIGFGINYHFNNRKIQKDKFNNELKLREALQDSVVYFKTEKGEWGAEKRSLQGNLNDLNSKNIKLNESQKALLNDVKRLDNERKNEKQIWAAARIEYQTLIDSINIVIANANEIDTINNLISFVQTDTAAHFIYDLDVLGVRPFPLNNIPQIQFNKIDFPNIQTITFEFDKTKRKDYPISFSVLNTNEYYKVYNVESYVIPGIQKSVVNQSNTQKVWKWIKINGKYILIGFAGYSIGTVINK